MITEHDTRGSARLKQLMKRQKSGAVKLCPARDEALHVIQQTLDACALK